ncbi:hypothetical protein MA16_Dca020245 [Dendrobium catenatum]|uniref:Uncharacterized protein n=1 Tax=Dendrobium catenatum TaxID=906689 RepID=A0A2I0X5Y3_9ASPA|nr:hypothetical protein MA16_Dca020245 [Dendrobium catenatum]
MSTYAKFMKKILNKKRKLGEFKIVPLTENYSALIQKKLSEKLKDLGNFIIPMIIGGKFCGRALCNLGSSINLIPLSIFKRMDVGGFNPLLLPFS